MINDDRPIHSVNRPTTTLPKTVRWLLTLGLVAASCSEQPPELQAILDDNPELADLEIESGRRVRRVLETGAPDPLYGWEGDIYISQTFQPQDNHTIDDVIDEIVAQAKQLGWELNSSGETIKGGRSLGGCNSRTHASVFATTTLPSSTTFDRVAFFLVPRDCTLEDDS